MKARYIVVRLHVVVLSIAAAFSPAPAAGRIERGEMAGYLLVLNEKGDAPIALDPAILGKTCRETVALSKAALASVKNLVPGSNGRCELSGFGGHQGWNDRINDKFNAEAYCLIGTFEISDAADRATSPSARRMPEQRSNCVALPRRSCGQIVRLHAHALWPAHGSLPEAHRTVWRARLGLRETTIVILWVRTGFRQTPAMTGLLLLSVALPAADGGESGLRNGILHAPQPAALLVTIIP